MDKKISSALISVFHKEGLAPIVQLLHQHQVTIYSTGGTAEFITAQGIPCIDVEEITSYPSILGGRVKTLHPKVFGGILGKRDDETHIAEMATYEIPMLDLVIVDLYPFEATVATTTDEKAIIEKIDIGGPSMIRAAAKNHKDVVVVAAQKDYAYLVELLSSQNGSTNLDQRRYLATRAFQVVGQYDIAIANWFLQQPENNILIQPINGTKTPLRYGENPHQKAAYYGDLSAIFTQLNGKAISYNNLTDIDSAIQLIQEFTAPTFCIIKHSNACGVASRDTIAEAWAAALAGDPESAFGGVLCCNGTIDAATATAISELFFEVLIAKDFDADALAILQQKKNRIILQQNKPLQQEVVIKSVLNGMLAQDVDHSNYATWNEVGGRTATDEEKENLIFANIIGKHLKSNAIALVKNKQLIGKGCGQTSRIDALRFAIEKAKQFEQSTDGAVLSSDAFFPFDDCIKMAHEAGIKAFIQPGGSVRDADSIAYAQTHNLVMVMTGERHFKH
jgi:phosphoribosylaminoimidazolecarboxamide formyltransferase / IMP cyclohydrolase